MGEGGAEGEGGGVGVHLHPDLDLQPGHGIGEAADQGLAGDGPDDLAGGEGLGEVVARPVRGEGGGREAADPEQGKQAERLLRIQGEGRQGTGAVQRGLGQHSVGQARPPVAPQGRAGIGALQHRGAVAAVKDDEVRGGVGFQVGLGHASLSAGIHRAATAAASKSAPARRSTLRGSLPITGP